MSDLSGGRAVGGVDIDNLGGDDGVVAPGGSASGGGKNDGSGELHLVGIKSNSKVVED